MAAAQKTAAQRRSAVAAQYRKFIGRNHYSQALRSYCVKKYKDGKYYSDCSSSVSYAYKQAGEGFGILNTVGMWTSKKLKDVAVVIKNGIIQNPEVLEVGDLLLFAGNDTSRKVYGYVGHVEMVGAISGKVVTLYGHGSGLAKQHEMNAYCRSRRNTKSSTPLGNRGLIRVRRAIWEDAGDGETSSVTAGAVPPSPEGTSSVTAGAVPPSPEGEGMGAIEGNAIKRGESERLAEGQAEGASAAKQDAPETRVCGNAITRGESGDAVAAMQRLLLRRDPKCLPRYGADGDFGAETEAAVKALQIYAGLPETGAFDDATAGALAAILSGKAVEATAYVNVRDAPGVGSGRIIGVLRRGELAAWMGHVSADGWYAVRFKDAVGWVSGKYARIAE